MNDWYLQKMENAKTLDLEPKLGAQSVTQKRKLGTGISSTNVSNKKFKSTPSREQSVNQTLVINKVRFDSLHSLPGFRFGSHHLLYPFALQHENIFDSLHLIQLECLNFGSIFVFNS